MSTLSIAVNKRLGERAALDVDFAAHSGITAIFGPSGAGKTSLLDCIAGLTSPDAGNITLAKTTWFDSTGNCDLPTRSRHIGYVFQSPALFPHMTAQENAEFGLSMLLPEERKALVDQAFAQFGISHLAHEKPSRISGGERQRVAIARALVTYPKVLLLDEPFAALDHATKTQCIEALRDWTARHQVPVLLVTHAIEEVFALADTTVCLESGRIVAQGPTGDVLAGAKEKLLEQLR